MKTKHILLIDDEEMPANYYVQAFEMEGVKVSRAKSTDEALDLAQKDGPFDMIIIDIMMPPGERLANLDTQDGLTSGIALYEMLAAICPNVPAIFLSNVRNQNILDQAARETKLTVLSKFDYHPFKLVDYVISRLV